MRRERSEFRSRKVPSPIRLQHRKHSTKMAATTEVDTLPLSVIAAIAKSGIGEGMNISKEAKVALQRAAGVFILYLNSAANDVCKSSKRSTVSGPDILRALEEIDMGELVKPCKETLEGEPCANDRCKQEIAARFLPVNAILLFVSLVQP